MRQSPTTTADEPDGGETAAQVSAKSARHVPSARSSTREEKKAKVARQERRPFDPFYLIPLFGRNAEDRSVIWLLLPMIVIGAAVLVATAVEGTFGTLPDISWITDLQYVFGRSVPYTPPHIPLLRDGPDIALFVLMAAGLVLLHRQWRYIAACVPQLRREGTLVPSERPRTNELTRALGLNRLIGTNGDYGGFDELERKLLRVGNRFRIFLVGFIVLGGLALALLLREALDANALRVFVPTDLTPAEQAQWLAEARQSWWAGSSHPVGYVLYGLIAWFGMSLIVAYNVMGLLTVYVAIAIFLVSKPTADWYNRDGRFGWLAMTQVYRTVYQTIVLFGAVMSVLVALLGSRTPIAVIGLAAMYLLLIPVYTFLPWLVFRRVEADIRENRMRELNHALDGVRKGDLGQAQAFVAEFDRCRTAKIRPMSIGRLRLSGFASVVALPIGLTLLQILLPLGFGR